MFKFLVTALLALATMSVQAFDPKKEVITVLIGFAPGGGTDTVIKPYLEKIEQLGYVTKMEYKPGAESSIAMNYFSKLPKDGKTILIAASSGLILSRVFQEEHVKNDGFDLITTLGFGPNVLITGADNINTFEDFSSDIKINDPKTFAAGSLLGAVSAQYIASKLGVSKDRIVIANYKGMAPATQDVAGGHVKYAVVPLTVALPMLDAGKIKLLAIGGSQRNSKYPKVPTFVEKIKGFAVETSESNWGVVLPKNSPKEIVDFYSNLFTALGKDKILQEKLATSFIFIKDSDLGPDKYNSVYKRSMDAWQELKN